MKPRRRLPRARYGYRGATYSPPPRARGERDAIRRTVCRRDNVVQTAERGARADASERRDSAER